MPCSSNLYFDFHLCKKKKQKKTLYYWDCCLLGLSCFWRGLFFPSNSINLFVSPCACSLVVYVTFACIKKKKKSFLITVHGRYLGIRYCGILQSIPAGYLDMFVPLLSNAVFGCYDRIQNGLRRSSTCSGPIRNFMKRYVNLDSIIMYLWLWMWI